MPPVPAELLGRIVALQARISALRGEIETAMARLPLAAQLPTDRPVRPAMPRVAIVPAAAASTAAPRFVDRRL